MRHVQEYHCSVVDDVRTRLTQYESLVMDNH